VSLIDVRDRAIIEYERGTDEDRNKFLVAFITHYDDIIKAGYLQCFGSTTHKGYFDE
jgi:hypothetical protein